MTLLSQQGKWIVPPIPELIMKDYNGPGEAIIESAWKNSKSGYIENLSFTEIGIFDRVVYSLSLPDHNTTWMLLVDVPVLSQTYMIVGRLVILGAVLFGLLISVRYFVQNLSSASSRMSSCWPAVTIRNLSAASSGKMKRALSPMLWKASVNGWQITGVSKPKPWPSAMPRKLNVTSLKAICQAENRFQFGYREP